MIKILPTTETPYLQYDGQCNPQDILVELDMDNGGILSVYANPEIGNAVPMAVWNGRIRRWRTSTYMTAQDCNNLMDEIAPIAERIVAGYTEEWDGNNHVGVYTDDAQAASEEVATICEEYEGHLEVLEASEWYSVLPDGLTGQTTDEELEEIIDREGARYTGDVEGEPIVLGIAQHLTDRRDELRDEMDS